ncbi:MAG: MoxR family ATPase [Saprospirales bacterium]|nr:MoxR family ATPase [Saprospirales bacterium]MBK6902902.1 MoxR family ATPase [Saprospirales bacterium]
MKINVLKPVVKAFDPETYVLDEELKNAVEVAIALNQPILLTGEPGTGKTRLADKVAHELAKDPSQARFHNKPLAFFTKTTSAARDLFYTYDALGHFQAANIKREETHKAPKTADFIDLQALGLAIAKSNPANLDRSKFKTLVGEEASSSVVLIDEIDKAPRDFTNDLLNEIERYEFFLKEEDNYPIRRGEEQRIVVIMTSNSEKNLPDAFLRRCVFYHIPFPTPEKLLQIAKAQLGESSPFTDQLLKDLIGRFGEVRAKAMRKPPATAELIGWLRILELQGILEGDAKKQQKALRDNLSILVKTKEDMDAVKAIFS